MKRCCIPFPGRRCWPVGVLEHFLKPGQKRKGEPLHTGVYPDASSGGKASSLEVLQVLPISLAGQAAEWWGADAYEVSLRLITGRTHQVRLP